jgi:hypothetical protein
MLAVAAEHLIWLSAGQNGIHSDSHLKNSFMLPALPSFFEGKNGTRPQLSSIVRSEEKCV